MSATVRWASADAGGLLRFSEPTDLRCANCDEKGRAARSMHGRRSATIAYEKPRASVNAGEGSVASKKKASFFDEAQV